jgi:hypothetical protein
MLEINIPAVELFDDASQRFVYSGGANLQLEHSLASLSKWESKWEKAFLGPGQRTTEEVVDYIRVMNQTPGVDPEVFNNLTPAQMSVIDTYMNAKMTATWFNEEKRKGPAREIITAELIYYWMTAHNIWLECQHWHLNKLLTLIKVHNQKSQPEKKRSPREIMEERRRLNDQRLKQHGTTG